MQGKTTNETHETNTTTINNYYGDQGETLPGVPESGENFGGDPGFIEQQPEFYDEGPVPEDYGDYGGDAGYDAGYDDGGGYMDGGFDDGGGGDFDVGDFGD